MAAASSPIFGVKIPKKICKLPARTVYPYESWLSIADWRCLHPSAAPPFVQEQLEVLPLDLATVQSSIIEAFVNLCTFFYILFFTKNMLRWNTPTARWFSKKSVDKVDLAWKKSIVASFCWGPQDFQQDTNKDRGHYITNPKQCISYQENPWKLPVPSTFIPPTQVAVHLVKLQYFTNLGFPGQ